MLVHYLVRLLLGQQSLLVLRKQYIVRQFDHKFVLVHSSHEVVHHLLVHFSYHTFTLAKDLNFIFSVESFLDDVSHVR